jgi:hypothetical protein
MKINKTLLISVLSLISFCAIAVLFKVFPIGELPASFIGAALGAVITGVVTGILLKGQTDAQEIKERNVGVFNKKSAIFQEYIKTVWKIWEDRKVTEDEFKKITSGYYRDLMIYLDDTKKIKIDGKDDPRKPSEIIAGCISEIGNNLEKEDYVANEKLTKQVVLIINVLSDQIGLGGQIKEEIIKKHDDQMFPIMFRKKILDAFNVEFSEAEGFKTGGWTQRANADVISFPFKDYPGCILHYGIHWEGNVTPFTRVEITVPTDHYFNSFNKYRFSGKRRRLNAYISTVDYDHDLFKSASTEDNVIIPAFHFNDEKSISNIRKHPDLNKIPEILAKRAFANYDALTVKLDGKSIPDFLAENHPQEGKI